MENTEWSKPIYIGKTQKQNPQPTMTASKKFNKGFSKNGWSPATKEHDGQIMRQFAYNKIFIQADGEYAESGDGGELMIRSREEDGAKYINVDGKPVWLDYMVASCFCHKDKNGKRYSVHHKNGDISDCSKENLEWVEKIDNGIQIIDNRNTPFGDE